MSTPSAISRFDRSMVSKIKGTCGFCGVATAPGVDFAVLNTGKWMGVCAFHANSVIEQVKAMVVKVQAAAPELTDVQKVAIDAHVTGLDLNAVMLGNATAAQATEAALALDSALRVIAVFAPAPAKVVTNLFAGKCADCGKTVAEKAGRREGTKGAWIIRHLDGQCPAADVVEPVTGLDLSPLKVYASGVVNGSMVRFGVPGGDTRLKVSIKFHDNGMIYVNDGAAYGERQTYGRQAPGQGYRGKIEDALKAILADPKGGIIRYAELTSHCGVCGRKLEDKTSVLQGMGPVCAGRF